MTAVWLFLMSNPWRGACIALLGVCLGLQVNVMRHKASTAAAKREIAELQAAWAKLERDAIQAARAKEQALFETLAKIEVQHHIELEEARNAQNAVIAGLRAGSLKLRNHWTNCEASRLSDSATAAGESQSAAERRAEDSGNLVRVGAECDARLRALVEAYEGVSK